MDCLPTARARRADRGSRLAARAAIAKATGDAE